MKNYHQAEVYIMTGAAVTQSACDWLEGVEEPALEEGSLAVRGLLARAEDPVGLGGLARREGDLSQAAAAAETAKRGQKALRGREDRVVPATWACPRTSAGRPARRSTIAP